MLQMTNSSLSRLFTIVLHWIQWMQYTVTLPSIASCKLSQVHVQFSGQWWDFEFLPYNAILFFK
jgi:hypothetical protein